MTYQSISTHGSAKVAEAIGAGVHCPICCSFNAAPGHHHIKRVANENAKTLGRHVYECSSCGTEFDIIRRGSY